MRRSERNIQSELRLGRGSDDMKRIPSLCILVILLFYQCSLISGQDSSILPTASVNVTNSSILPTASVNVTNSSILPTESVNVTNSTVVSPSYVSNSTVILLSTVFSDDCVCPTVSTIGFDHMSFSTSFQVGSSIMASNSSSVTGATNTSVSPVGSSIMASNSSSVNVEMNTSVLINTTASIFSPHSVSNITLGISVATSVSLVTSCICSTPGTSVGTTIGTSRSDGSMLPPSQSILPTLSLPLMSTSMPPSMLPSMSPSKPSTVLDEFPGSTCLCPFFSAMWGSKSMDSMTSVSRMSNSSFAYNVSSTMVGVSPHISSVESPSYAPTQILGSPSYMPTQSVGSLLYMSTQSLGSPSYMHSYSPSYIDRQKIGYTCACSSLPPSSRPPSSLPPSSFPSVSPSSSIMSSMAPPPGRLPIPRVFNTFHADMKSGVGRNVSDIFKYLNLTASQSIALTNIDIIGGGKLFVKYVTTWETIDTVSISNATILNGEMVKIIGDATFSGVVNVTFEIILYTNQRFADVKSLSDGGFVLYILMAPHPPTLQFNTSVLNLTVNEEDIICFSLFDYITITSPVQPDLDINLSGPENGDFLAAVNLYKVEFNRLKRGLIVKEVSSEKGKWTYDLVKSPSRDSECLCKDVDVFNSTTKYCFYPGLDFYGMTTIVFSSGTKDTIDKKSEYTFDLTVNINILNINDAPTIGTLSVNAPAIPYSDADLDAFSYNVSDIVISGKLSDVDNPDDNTVLGIAIIYGRSSHLGNFQYNCNGTWMDVNIINTRPIGKSSSVNAIFLVPNNGLRFNMVGSTYWTIIKALEYASMTFVAWDMTNSKECGEVKINVSEADVGKYISKYDSAAILKQLRFGCDKKPGTVEKDDVCGVCGGDNSTCTGCDGVLYSNATYDTCLVCAGGDTNITPNMDIDCAETCNKSYRDSCDTCQVKGFNTERDCNNDCLGTAISNKCQECVLGNTTRNETFGTNECGGCNGTKLDCLDCAGVPNGDNKTDVCGNCLKKTDPLFNKGCGIKLDSFVPDTISGEKGRDIVIQTSSTVSPTSCTFNSIPATKIKLKVPELTLTTPSNFSAGSYNIQCVFTTATVNATGKLTVLDFSNINITSISPNITKVNNNDTLTLTGVGFANTSHLACLYGNKHFELKVTFVSETEIICKLPTSLTARNIETNVYLSFIPYHKGMEAKLLPTVKHYIGDDVPSVVSAKFNAKLSGVKVTFDSVGRLAKGATCGHIFTYNHTTFGQNPICKFRKNVLFISMTASSTLGVGKLILNVTKIQAKGPVTIYPQNLEQTVVIASPDSAMSLDASIYGPEEVGSCDKIVMQVRVKGGNPGRLTYQWSVQLAPGETSLDNATSILLNALNSSMPTTRKIKLTAEQTSFNEKKMIYSVVITNFLDGKTVARLPVTRKSMELPRVTLSRRKITTRVGKDLSIRARAKTSSCLDKNIYSSKLSYQWEISPSAGITLENAISSKVYIPADQLKPNKIYTLTVQVSMREKPESKITQSATIQTVGSPIRGVITAVQTVGQNDMLALSAEDSYDPDKVPGETAKYSWEVLNMDGSAVFLKTKDRVTLPSTQTVYFNVTGKLKVGTRYKFVLKYSIGIRVNEVKSVIRVIDHTPPSVVMSNQHVVKVKSNKIVVQATIRGSTGGTFTWSNVNSASDGQIELTEDNLLSPHIGTYRANIEKTTSLKFRRNVLSNDITYYFNLTATSKRNVSASAVYELKLNTIPSTGVVEISPSSGIALNTTFTISATNGWIHSGDLKYKFAYSTGRKKPIWTTVQDEPTYTLLLPPGSVTVYVQCVDINGGYSEEKKTITVEAASASDLDSAHIIDELTILNDEQNIDQFIDLATTYIFAIKVSVTEEQKKIQGYIVITLSVDPQGLIEVDVPSRVAALAVVTDGGQSFTVFVKTAVLDFLRITLKITTSGGRRRREITSGNEVDQKNILEVEDALEIYSNLISQDLYDTIAQKTKAEFFLALDKLTPSMCKGFVVGEAAGLAKSEQVYLQTIMKDLTDVATVPIKLGCAGLGCDMRGPDSVTLGSDFTNLTMCGANGDEGCDSVCVSSWQMKNDLVSSGQNSSIKSSILAIKFWEPEKLTQLGITNIPTGMLVDIIGTNSDPTKTYVCVTWDTGSSSWVTTGVEFVKVQVVLDIDGGANDVITCKMTRLAYLALMEGPPKIKTTAAPNVTANASVIQPSASYVTMPSSVTPSPTLNPSNYPRIIHFSFNYPKENCTRKVNNDHVGFVTVIRDEVAKKSVTDPKGMKDFNITCASILVDIRLIQSGVLTVEESARRILNMVTRGLMNITIDNSVVLANISSFRSYIDPNYVVKPTDDDDDEDDDDDDLSTGAIIGIVIGVIALILIVILLVYCCCIKKNSRKQGTVEPDDQALELKGRTNKTYTDAP